MQSAPAHALREKTQKCILSTHGCPLIIWLIWRYVFANYFPARCDSRGATSTLLHPRTSTQNRWTRRAEFHEFFTQFWSKYRAWHLAGGKWTLVNYMVYYVMKVWGEGRTFSPEQRGWKLIKYFGEHSTYQKGRILISVFSHSLRKRMITFTILFQMGSRKVSWNTNQIKLFYWEVRKLQVDIWTIIIVRCSTLNNEYPE